MGQKRKADNELPRSAKESLTLRRKTLRHFIQIFSDIMPRVYSNYRRAGREYKIHVRSRVCGEYHLKGGTYDIRIT